MHIWMDGWVGWLVDWSMDASWSVSAGVWRQGSLREGLKNLQQRQTLCVGPDWASLLMKGLFDAEHTMLPALLAHAALQRLWQHPWPPRWHRSVCLSVQEFGWWASPHSSFSISKPLLRCFQRPPARGGVPGWQVCVCAQIKWNQWVSSEGMLSFTQKSFLFLWFSVALDCFAELCAAEVCGGNIVY